MRFINLKIKKGKKKEKKNQKREKGKENDNNEKEARFRMVSYFSILIIFSYNEPSTDNRQHLGAVLFL